jgi:hypothetical protein
MALNISRIILGGFSILLLVAGFYWLRWAKWNNLSNRTASNIFLGQILRASFFESIAVYGFILKLLGDDWYVAAVMFIITGATLILTFPTRNIGGEHKIGGV